VETNSIAAAHPFGYIKDEKVFLKSFLHFPEREIGVVKESETDSMRF
jgi:hypothetical protein